MVKDKDGKVVELHCTYDPETRSGEAGSSRKVKGTIHWVSAAHALKAEVRLYDRLFTVENPGDVDDFVTVLNPNSLETVTGYVEPSLAGATPGSKYQFERLGYFCADLKDCSRERIVFNRTVTLRDTWAKIAKKL
jgi:glutaminyl-tRNA synthetase